MANNVVFALRRLLLDSAGSGQRVLQRGGARHRHCGQLARTAHEAPPQVHRHALLMMCDIHTT